MHNEEHRTPRRGPGHGSMRNTGEKAKDFKASITRLFKELNPFKFFIIFALMLAIVGSILSIVAPNQLSKLTDEISAGLVIDSKNLEEITTKTTKNLDQEVLGPRIQDILAIDLSRDTVRKVMMSSEVTSVEKENFQTILEKISDDQSEAMNMFSELPDSILHILLSDSTYQGVNISSDDKISFVRNMSQMTSQENMKNLQLSDSIAKVILPEIKVDGVVISSKDQMEFLTLMSTVDKDAAATEIYKKLDDAPKTIQKLVEPFMDIKQIQKISFFLVCLYLCSAFFSYIESIIMTTVSNKFAKHLRGKISKKINLLPLKYFDKHAIGDILSRVTNDVDTIAQSMNMSLATLVSSLTLFIGTIIMMFCTNWVMALTAIGASLFGFLFMFLILGKSQKYFVARQEELGNLNGHIEEIYSGLNVVKAYNGKKEADEKFDLYNKKVYEANRKSQFLSGLMTPIMNFVGNFGYVAVCIVGALLTVNDMITFGVIVAFISYVRLFTSPLSQIAQAMTSLQSVAAASERVFEFVDEEEMSSQKDATEVLDRSKVKGKIEFDQVSFQYDGNDTPTIHSFSATALPGQKIAIVGPTGAGKTTMVNLLMKFYDINSGDIKIDGVSIQKLTRENIHDLFTMVLQDTWLFDGSVKENIVYNRDGISDERVEAVCKTVGLDHFIKTLPQGYDTILSNNETVSAGQRQLLTIARGMIEECPFLILDEATSNVDTRTEELVQKAMDKLTEGKTSFIIAHRLSTIKNADLILVMRDGNIIEQGNHRQLMKKNGFYADLYNSQFEL